MRVLKGFARGFWDFINHGSSVRRIAIGIWLFVVFVIDPVRLFGHLSHMHDTELMLSGYAMLVPVVLYSWFDLAIHTRKYRRESKKLDAEIKRLQIKSIVLDVMLELEFHKMTPEQRTEAMYKMPAGPKE